MHPLRGKPISVGRDEWKSEATARRSNFAARDAQGAVDRSEIGTGAVSIAVIAAQPDSVIPRIISSREHHAARSNELALVSPRFKLLEDPLARDTLADPREHRRLAKFTLLLPHATRTEGKRAAQRSSRCTAARFVPTISRGRHRHS